METWKKIDIYNYSVSNLGNIKNDKTGRLRKLSVGYWGYVQVGFIFDKKHKHFTVHRLVAKYFIPNPKNKPYVNHKNNVRSDNRVENLEWCTQEENMAWASKGGRLGDNGNISKEERKRMKYSIEYYRNYYKKNAKKIQAQRLERMKERFSGSNQG